MNISTNHSAMSRPEGLEGVELLKASFTGQTFARHFHDVYAVGVIVRGALGFRYLRRPCLAPAGSISQVIPGEVHDGHPAAPEGWSYRMFYLEPKAVEDVAAELAGRPLTEPVFAQGVLSDPALARRLLALHRGLMAGAFTLLERQSLLRHALAIWITRHGGNHLRSPHAGREDKAVRRTREYLQAHASEPVSLAELAAEAGLSPFHLNRVFALQTGLPPHAYQNQLRILMARKLLATGTPVAQAAQNCGFADQSHLTRRFKHFMGITPGRYRKIVQDR